MVLTAHSHLPTLTGSTARRPRCLAKPSKVQTGFETGERLFSPDWGVTGAVEFHRRKSYGKNW